MAGVIARFLAKRRRKAEFHLDWAIAITEGGPNVFEDLCLPNPDELLAWAERRRLNR